MSTPRQDRTHAEELVELLTSEGVEGVLISWADNNGISRARVIPVSALPGVSQRGVGVTVLFAVFDSHDAITHGYPGLGTASGDRRLVPLLDGIRPLAGQPRLAWAPGIQFTAEGERSAYDQRHVLEEQVQRARSLGLEILAGYELEFTVHRDGQPAHSGPAYSAQALIQVDDLVAELLHDFAANGLRINQLHAEYGLSQLEVSLAATDPLSAADEQLLARQTIHAAAARNGYRISFAPLVDAAGVGNGWHVHTSVWRNGRNLIAPTGTGDVEGLGAEGASWLAGLLEHLDALSAITAPSVPSRLRLRPGYFAGAYAFWGLENREATLRVAQGGELVTEGYWNVELKASDASANPHLALGAILAAGLDGIASGLTPPPSITADPGTWSAQEREARGIELLPQSSEAARAALEADPVISGTLGADLLGAFLAARRSDEAWAADKDEETWVDGHRWIY